MKVPTKVKCVRIELGSSCLTVGKVYDVIAVDEDGDIWIIGDVGDEFFMYPRECEVVEG